MDFIAAALDLAYAFGGIACLSLLAYGAWTAVTRGGTFPQEGKGRFAWRHLHRARRAPRHLAS